MMYGKFNVDHAAVTIYISVVKKLLPKSFYSFEDVVTACVAFLGEAFTCGARRFFFGIKSAKKKLCKKKRVCRGLCHPQPWGFAQRVGIPASLLKKAVRKLSRWVSTNIIKKPPKSFERVRGNFFKSFPVVFYTVDPLNGQRRSFVNTPSRRFMPKRRTNHSHLQRNA